MKAEIKHHNTEWGLRQAEEYDAISATISPATSTVPA